MSCEIEACCAFFESRSDVSFLMSSSNRFCVQTWAHATKSSSQHKRQNRGGRSLRARSAHLEDWIRRFRELDLFRRDGAIEVSHLLRQQLEPFPRLDRLCVVGNPTGARPSHPGIESGCVVIIIVVVIVRASTKQAVPIVVVGAGLVRSALALVGHIEVLFDLFRKVAVVTTPGLVTVLVVIVVFTTIFVTLAALAPAGADAVVVAERSGRRDARVDAGARGRGAERIGIAASSLSRVIILIIGWNIIVEHFCSAG